MKKHFVHIPLLILLLFACSQHPSETNESDLSLFFPLRDTLGYDRTIDSDHNSVRRQIDTRLSQNLLATAQSDSLARDSSEEELTWLVSLYTRKTEITDKERCLDLYRSWDPCQAAAKLSLDSVFRSANSAYRSQNVSEPSSAFLTYDSVLLELQQKYMSLGDSSGLASVLSYRANVLYNNDRIDDADLVLSGCVKLSHDLDLHERLGNCNLLWAKIASVHRGDPFTAEKRLLEAHDCFVKIGRSDLLTYVLTQRAYNLLQQSQPEKAIHLLNEAAEGYRQVDRDLDEGFCQYFIAECYYDMQQQDSAWSYAQQSWRTRKNTYRKYGNASGLVRWRAHSDLAHSLSLMGLIKHARGEFDAARARFSDASEIFDLYPDTSDICLNRGRLAWLMHDLGNFNQAGDLFRQNLLESSRFEDWFDAVYGTAVCEYRLGRHTEAGKLAKLAIGQLESVRSNVPLYEMKAGLLAGKVRAYDLAATIYVDKYRQSSNAAFLDSCLYYLELVKARTLRSMLCERNWITQSDTEHQLVESRSDMLARLISASADTTADTTGVWDQIDSVSDSLYRLRLSEIPASVKSQEEFIHAHLLRPGAVADGDAVLAYQLSPFGCFALLFTPGETHLYEISISYDSLSSLVRDYRCSISSPPDIVALQNGPNAVGKALFQHLIPTGVARDSTISRLIVILSDMLYSLPLETLVDTDGRYLAERYSVSYATSLGSMNTAIKPDRRSQSPARIVAFGDPTLDAAGQFEQLAYSRKEIASIQGIFGQANTSVFVGEAATEANFKAVDFSFVDFVHIASHGFCDFTDPANSAILFSASHPEQPVGLLHPDEIRYLDMPADAVFLSTCQSGTGRMLPGEGLMGLARPFLLAGANSVVVTMWNVDDRSSAIFVKEFYTRIVEGQSVAISLGHARRKLLDSGIPLYRHPYFWGPYIALSSH